MKEIIVSQEREVEEEIFQFRLHFRHFGITVLGSCRGSAVGYFISLIDEIINYLCIVRDLPVGFEIEVIDLWHEKIFRF